MLEMLGWLIVLICFQGSKLQTHANSWWWHGKKLCKILLWELPQSRRLEVSISVQCCMNGRKWLYFFNFCQASLIPIICLVKHYESYSKKEWCFSLWNILIHFMTLDYLENWEKHVSFPSGSREVLRKSKGYEAVSVSVGPHSSLWWGEFDSP